MRKYLVTGHRPVEGAGPGEEVELDLSILEENDHLDAERLAPVERRYRVVGSREVFDTEPGKEFERALRLEQEQMLIDGGHIELVDDEPKKKPKPKPKGGDGKNDDSNKE